MKTSLMIFVAVAAFSFGQTTNTKKGIPPAKPDTWQKSKDCVSQAEKMVATWPKRTGFTPNSWSNHYSIKYDRCFVTLSFMQKSEDEKTFPTLFTKSLHDAFEYSTGLANSCALTGNGDCVEYMAKNLRDGTLDAVSKKLNGKAFADASAEEQEIVRRVADPIIRDHPVDTRAFCGIDGKAVECPKAEAFIAEHMRN